MSGLDRAARERITEERQIAIDQILTAFLSSLGTPHPSQRLAH
jgi:hypothetical protein